MQRGQSAEATTITRVRRPRVVVSAGQMSGGGVQTHIMLLCRVLREAGARVDLVGTHRGWSAADIHSVRGLGVRVWTPPAALAPARRLSRLFPSAAVPLGIPFRGR